MITIEGEKPISFKRFHEECRVHELRGKISKHIEFDLKIPIDNVEEYNKLIDKLV